MSDAPKDEPPQPGLMHAGIRLADRVAHSLAPQFLALLVLNVLIVGGLGWYVDARARHTAELLNRLLTACIERVPAPIVK